jgi:hypothetical protein
MHYQSNMIKDGQHGGRHWKSKMLVLRPRYFGSNAVFSQLTHCDGICEALVERISSGTAFYRYDQILYHKMLILILESLRPNLRL